MSGVDIKKLADDIASLSLLEAKQVLDLLAESGIKPTTVVGAAVQEASNNEQSAAAEKSTFTVYLKSAGGAKLGVIKIVKDINVIGLKEAKDLVDGAPCVLKENVSKADADNYKAQLEGAGAEVELK